ncbi:SDR family NAD(P)-dependent oxidoreductase [Streptomyces sp. NPDC048606]|uniref:SDR family NAD(P)-dependent oxidoreductase n=1 Tax=Streptomyces sp. NPDC048606 TaxID=3154726 RepID=UPI003420996A
MESEKEVEDVPVPRNALVTGCSSGIGRATAIRLRAAGLRVWATARRPEALDDLAAEGMDVLALDVTDPDSAKAAVEAVARAAGGVDVLVNNAGFGLAGTFEETGLDRVRAQFETNVFGVVGLTQLVLPGMRERGGGSVVNVSSIFGRYAAPGGGFYHASKHALEGLSDALRLEVAGFGIRVSLVEPGPVRTAWADTFVSHLAGEGEGHPAYRRFHRRTAEYYAAVYDRGRRTLAGTFAVEADDVARAIERAALSRRPKARYPVGFLAASTLALRRLAPDSVFDNAYIRRQFPVP